MKVEYKHEVKFNQIMQGDAFRSHNVDEICMKVHPVCIDLDDTKCLCNAVGIESGDALYFFGDDEIQLVRGKFVEE